MNPRSLLLRRCTIDTGLPGTEAAAAADDGTDATATTATTATTAAAAATECAIAETTKLGPGSHPPADAEHIWLRVLGKRQCVRPCSADGTDWPQRTDTWCWWCCHPFDGSPLPLPFKYDSRRDVFHVMGTFCSWACMKAYNSDSASYLKNVTATNITLFHKRCTGRLAGVHPAPPRITLKVFGGTMTIDEFRAASAHDSTYRLLPPRMILHSQAVEENVRRSAAERRRPPANLAAAVNFKDVVTKNETLRLKRPKPLQSNRNLLERAMGINAVGQ